MTTMDRGQQARTHWLPMVLRQSSFVILVGFVAAFGMALLLAVGWMGAPQADIVDLLTYLGFSTAISLALIVPVLLWLRHGRARLVIKLVITCTLGLVITALNIMVTAQLMFISPHDRQLLLLLLAFTAIITLALGITLAHVTSEGITRLRDGAHELAAGNLETRVAVHGGGELAELATDFNDLAMQLAAAAQERQRLEATRRELFAAISHDLRTPLAAISALIEALEDGVVSDPALMQRSLATLRSQTTHLSRLIDDLFELAQIDAGALRLEREPASLPDLISDTLEALSVPAAQKGVRLSGEVGPGVGMLLMAPSKIERVLYNLVSNAIRHTPSGGSITITARRIAAERSPGAKPNDGEAAAVLVEVADTGEGIDAADLPRIFESFYRGEKSRSRATGGAGLGLAIAQGIVSAHGGRIWAESQRGVGTQMRFTLPQS